MDKLELLRIAEEARMLAYSPYSHISIGAALLGVDGSIHTGCNVENASYGLTCCAERVAVFSAVAAGVRKFKALALAGEGRVLPCGACLQVLNEFCPGLELYINDGAGGIEILSLKALLPMAFELPPPKGE